MASALIKKNTKPLLQESSNDSSKICNMASSQYQIYAEKQFDLTRNDTKKKLVQEARYF